MRSSRSPTTSPPLRPAGAAGENFTVLDTAALGQVYRGVDVAPVSLPSAAWLLLSGFGALGLFARRAQVLPR